MTGRRLSKRDSSVTKRKKLEDKLKKKAEEANFRKEKARSKALKQLQDQELQLFTEEALRLSDLVESLEFSPNKATDNLSQESLELEWDNSEELPSFLTATSKSDLSVDGLIEEILSPSPTRGDLQVPSCSRRTTSTDPDFLDSPGLPQVGDKYPHLGWPPKFPSAEPEVYSPIASFSLVNFDVVPESDEVFEEAVQDTVVTQTMEEEVFKSRYKAVKSAARKVDSEVKHYLPENITAIDVSTYNERLKLVKDKFEKFDDLVSDLVIDLDSTNATDQARMTLLKKSLRSCVHLLSTTKSW